ncbi:type II toxin-antitoxin system VapC family toxin [Streptosporangium sp. NPDC087985]|uniref:type II toxin-antitoxin system VapC family toxin n=1 Tax=Streptosporangium sp. NPDC087985 TaxID=3366196 RepID=UPI0038242216
MIVVDTGPIVAAAIRNDRRHGVCVEVFNQFRRERRELLVLAFVAGEASYMLGKIGGAKVEAGFLRSLKSGVFDLVDLTDDDLDRIADLVERYSDLPLGSADASVVRRRASSNRRGVHSGHQGLLRGPARACPRIHAGTRLISLRRQLRRVGGHQRQAK